MKSCNNPDCIEQNPQLLDRFYKSSRNKCGLHHQCKTCHGARNKRNNQKNKDAYRVQKREYRNRDRARYLQKQRDSLLKREYGISREEWLALFLLQKGCCAICKVCQTTLKKPLAVDHNHSTGQVRALLCYHCNWLIGHAKEDPNILTEAIDYLKKYQKLPTISHHLEEELVPPPNTFIK